MQKRAYTLTSLLAAVLLASGCESDTSGLETPNPNLVSNAGLVSQKNFSILAEDVFPEVIDPDTGAATDTQLEITVKVGDRKNQLLTDTHTVYFATEWGLISPSCDTVDGTCTVTWQTSFGDDENSQVPQDAVVTITAWTAGEESFIDTNGNALFDDADTVFTDREEPYVDANENGVYDSGEQIIDTVNGNDPRGDNGVHDIGDTFLNSPHCTHSSLCSPTLRTATIWAHIAIVLTGPPDTGGRQ